MPGEPPGIEADDDRLLAFRCATEIAQDEVDGRRLAESSRAVGADDQAGGGWEAENALGKGVSEWRVAETIVVGVFQPTIRGTWVRSGVRHSEAPV